MTTPPTRNRDTALASRGWTAAVLALALAAGGFLLFQGLQPCDDAYITFRHARHLAQHLAPTWNLYGEPVMGSTSPAFVFLLGLPALVVGAARIETVALLENALLHAAIVILVYLAAWDLMRRRFAAWLAAALVAVNSVTVFVFSLGFENALLTAVLLAALVEVRRERYWLATVLASVAPLIRPEGLLLTPLVLGYGFLARRRRPRLLAAYLAAYLVVPLAWVGFSTAYYGSPLPQPLVAKQKFPAMYRPYRDVKVDLSERISQVPASLTGLVSHKVTPLLLTGTVTGRTPIPFGRTWLGLAAAAAAFWLLTLLVRRDGRIVYLLYPLLFLVLYAWIGRTEVWYWPSFVTFALLALFTGSAFTVGWFLGLVRLKRRGAVEVAWVATFLLFLTANHYQANQGRHADAHKAAVYAADPRGPSWRGHERERFESYRHVAMLLNERNNRENTAKPEPDRRAGHAALTSEVGVFGYFYQGPVVDAVGLCSREVLAFYPPPRWDIFDEKGRYRTWANNFVPTAMVTTLEPRYVVNSLVYIANFFREGSPVPDAYGLVEKTGRAWGHPIYVLERKPESPRTIRSNPTLTRTENDPSRPDT
jgi:hypothetical protein